MRKRLIRLTNGDRVRLQMSPYDVNKACIVYRMPWRARRSRLVICARLYDRRSACWA